MSAPLVERLRRYEHPNAAGAPAHLVCEARTQIECDRRTIEAQAAEIERLKVEVSSKSDQIGMLYKVCNEKAVWQNRAEKVESELAAKDAALTAMSRVALHQTDRVGLAPPPFNHVHPLTCGRDSSHTPLFPFWNGDRVQLICRDCDYTQDNAGPFAAAIRASGKEG